MPQQELLIRVVRVLEGCSIEYMVTGSVASSLQGEPRSTHDLDLVVELRQSAVPALVDAFPSPEFYFSKEAVHEAVARGSMVNLLATQEGDKVDFWMLTDTPFDRSRFARRLTEEVFGIALRVSTPEDTILAKLSWAERSGGSEKHFLDAVRVYEVQRAKLDESYLDTWAEELDVVPLLARLRSEAEPD